MNIKELFNRLLRRRKQANQPESMAQPRLPSKLVLNLLRRVEQTEQVEFTCDEVYHLMDQYAEMVKRGDDAAKLMPLVKQHLELCSDCREELEALLRFLESSSTS